MAATLALLGVTRPAAALSCTLTPNLLFSYPSAERGLVRPGDVFWVVGDFGTGEIEVAVDGAPLAARGESGPERWQFLPGELTPGAHRLELTLRHIGDGGEPERMTLPFEVAAGSDSLAPDAQALPQRVRYYPTVGGDSAVQQATSELQSELLALEDDCSEFVVQQGPAGGCGGIDGSGTVRLEFDARGDALGFFTQGYFLPAGCHAAFFPELFQLPLDIYPITTRGLGQQALFEGQIEIQEVYVPPPSYGRPPIVETPAWESSESSACALSRRPGQGVAGAGVLLALGVALTTRRRARRR